MAYDKTEIFKQALKATEQEDCAFISDIIAHLPISSSSFYEYFQKDSEEMESLKKGLEKNKINLKLKLRKQWLYSKHPALQLALYKLLSEPEELSKLSMQKVSLETIKEQPLFPGINLDVE